MCPTDAESKVLESDRRYVTPIILDRLDKLEIGHKTLNDNMTGLKSEMFVLKDCVTENTNLTRDIKNFLVGVKTTRKITKGVYKTIVGLGALCLAIAAIWVLVVAIETGHTPGSLTPP